MRQHNLRIDVNFQTAMKQKDINQAGVKQELSAFLKFELTIIMV
jgi:hypothetical protein